MKNLSIYTSLQTQYQKLTQLLRSKGNQLSQFKHQQLLNRINRCSLQLKRLGMGMSVCVALGVGTPVMGQYVPPAFAEHDGSANPLEGILVDLTGPQAGTIDRPVFVDIDDDGDFDMFSCEYLYDVNIVRSRAIKYYENIGTATLPSFVSRTGSLNPLNGVEQFKSLEFVDIDNDGDYDLFMSAYGRALAYNATPICVYYENIGNASLANFIQRLGNTNPLDSVTNHLAGIANVEFYPSFVDIDNDGDLDCFGGVLNVTNSSREYWYYRNQGTTINPIFRKQSNHALSVLNPGLQTPPLWFMYKPEFYDFDKDGDKDLFAVNPLFSSYFENTGTISSPIFTATAATSTPIDSIKSIYPNYKGFSFVDIDGDTDLDAFNIKQSSFNNDLFFENLDTTIVSSLVEVQKREISVYPNPTTGILNFEKPITGSTTLFNTVGQQIWGKELYEEQEINLSELDNGIYFLEIETTKERIRKKVLVQK